MVFFRIPNNTNNFYLPLSLNDTLGIADDGNFLVMMGARSLAASATVAQGNAPYNSVFEIFCVEITGNGHDAGSVTTWTLLVEGIDTTFILTVPPETIGSIRIVGTQPINQFNRMVFRFNSTDPASAAYRGCCYGGRIT